MGRTITPLNMGQQGILGPRTEKKDPLKLWQMMETDEPDRPKFPTGVLICVIIICFILYKML